MAPKDSWKPGHQQDGDFEYDSDKFNSPQEAQEAAARQGQRRPIFTKWSGVISEGDPDNNDVRIYRASEEINKKDRR